MQEDIRIFKEQVINDYITDLLTQVEPENINVDMVKKDLAQLLGEMPAIQLKYKSEVPLLEDGSKGKRIEELAYIEVTYSYDKLVGDISVPLPVTLPYRVR